MSCCRFDVRLSESYPERLVPVEAATEAATAEEEFSQSSRPQLPTSSHFPLFISWVFYLPLTPNPLFSSPLIKLCNTVFSALSGISFTVCYSVEDSCLPFIISQNVMPQSVDRVLEIP